MGARMATGTFKKIITKQLLAFNITAMLLALLVIITFYSLFSNFEWTKLVAILHDKYIIYVINFTLLQASLSTILSIILAIPIARSLHRRTEFFGRKFILHFLNLAFVLPAITLVLGIAIIHGKNGWINILLQNIFHTSFDYYLYGIFGVMLGHLSFCLPLAVRILLSNLDTIPKETWRLTSQLNFSSLNIFKVVEWPYLRRSTTAISILIFMMCFSSFTIVLALGGEPAVTTIEVAIYQALKFDFDLSYASNLSLIQFFICGLLMLLVYKFNLPVLSSSLSNLNHFKRHDIFKTSSLIIDSFFICILTILTILPVTAAFISGFNQKFLNVLHSDELINSVKQSILIAFCSGILTLTISLSLISGAFYYHYILNKKKFAERIASISNLRLMIPTFVFSTGLFITLNNFTSIDHIAFYLVILMNSIAALPFAVNIIFSASLGFSSQEIHLCQNLNIKGWDFIKLIYWPKMRKAISYALALSITISWGDLSLIALFNSNELTTLPYLLYDMMSSYRIEEASVVALITLLSSFFLFWFIEEFLGGE